MLTMTTPAAISTAQHAALRIKTTSHQLRDRTSGSTASFVSKMIGSGLT